MTQEENEQIWARTGSVRQAVPLPQPVGAPRVLVIVRELLTITVLALVSVLLVSAMTLGVRFAEALGKPEPTPSPNECVGEVIC